MWNTEENTVKLRNNDLIYVDNITHIRLMYEGKSNKSSHT